MSDGTYFTPPHMLDGTRIAEITEGTGGALWRIACELAQPEALAFGVVAGNPPFAAPIETASNLCYDGGSGTGEA